MAKILILYDSATGRTQKMAQFVAEGVAKIPEHIILLKSIYEANEENLWCGIF